VACALLNLTTLNFAWFCLHRNGQILGLSTLTDNFNYILWNGNTTWKIDAPSVIIQGDYSINAVVTLPDQEPMTLVGTGRLFFEIKNTHIFITFKLPLFGNVRILELDIFPEIGSVTGGAGNLLINGEPVDWEKFSEEFQTNFEMVWGSIKAPLIDFAVETVDYIAGV